MATDTYKNIDLHGGVQVNKNGSLTMFATIYNTDLFKMTYYDYDIATARALFRKDCLKERDSYIVEIKETLFRGKK
tara:strand:- start:186 stop:413 length:228 start_codon:yes stop_codon:yes gene_type:complete